MKQLHLHERAVPRLFVLVFMIAGLAGCATAVPAAPTAAPATAVVAAAETVPALPTTAPTWTPVPVVVEETVAPTLPPPPTSTSPPTSTVAAASPTPEATATATAEPTATPLPATATQTPAPAAPAATVAATAVPPQPAATEAPPENVAPPAGAELGANLLPNPSFEEGHYLQNGIPELQLPNGWRLEWSEAPTGLGNAAWDVYVRPEVRVLSTAFLPPEEHPLYIYNGQHTVKAFKGSGAVDFQLLTDVTLQPGTYVIEAKMFADTVERWENRQKVWAGDPTSAEFRFRVGDGGTTWTPQRLGQINIHNYTFTIDEAKTIPIGIGLRGRYAIANNGWFIDDLSLRRVE